MSFLPPEMEDRMYELEDILAYGQIKKHHLREIFDIYNTACALAEEMREDKIFKKYIKKMQDVFMNENVLKILPQLQLESPMTLTVEEKKHKVDTIKNLLNQRKLLTAQAARITEQLIIDLAVFDSNANDLVLSEMNFQSEGFIKKLEQRKANSTSNKKNTITNKLRQSKTMRVPSFNSIDSSNKNNRKQSDENNANANNTNNKLNVCSMGQSRSKPKYAKKRQPSMIYEDKYEGKLEELLTGLWNTCSTITKDATINKMETVYAEMSERFLKEAMGILLKYNNELKDIDDQDLDDPNNVNAIIYKQLISDRDNELYELKDRVNAEKKQKLKEIQDEQYGEYDKVREISKVKIDVLHELIKTKIPEAQMNNNSISNNVIKDEGENEDDTEDNKEGDKKRITINTNEDERISRLSINEVKNTDDAGLRYSVLWNNNN